MTSSLFIARLRQWWSLSVAARMPGAATMRAPPALEERLR